jgi:Family of unknown function (DUF6263)
MLSRRCLWLAGVLLLAAANACAAPLPGESALRYQIKEGDKLRYVIEEKAIAEMANASGSIKIEGTVVFDLTWQATKVGKDGKVLIEQTFDRVRVIANVPGGKLDYDSKAAGKPEDAANKQLAEAMNFFVGDKMFLALDSRGRIENLKYSKKLAAAVAKLSPGAASHARSLSEDSLRRMVGVCVPVLPEKAPAKGTTWASTLKAKFAGAVNFTLDNKYAYEGEVKRDGRTVAKIVNRPTLTLSATAGTGIDVKALSQDVSSTAYFDRASGRLVESMYSQKVELEISANGEKVTMKGNSQMRLKLVEKKE